MANTFPTTTSAPFEVRTDHVVNLVTSQIRHLAGHCGDELDLSDMQEILGRAVDFAFALLSPAPGDEVLLKHTIWEVGEAAIAAHRKTAATLEQIEAALEAGKPFHCPL